MDDNEYLRRIVNSYTFRDAVRREAKDVAKTAAREQFMADKWWDTFFQRDHVQHSINAQVAPAVKKVAEGVVPSIVKSSVMEVLPGYLDNNYQMRSILDAHIPRVESQIESAARTSIDRILKEEQYQFITEGFQRSLSTRCSTAISQTKAEMVDMSKQIEQKHNQQLAELESKRKEIDGLKSSNSYLKWGMGATWIGMAGLGAAIFRSR